MTISSQAQDILEAYNSTWSLVVAEAVLSSVPKDEHTKVLALLHAVRTVEVENALKYSKIVGNPRRKAKFLAQVKASSDKMASDILSRISA